MSVDPGWAERPPVAIVQTGLALLGRSYTDVAQVFAGFRPPRNCYGEIERGQYPVPQKNLRGAHPHIKRGEGYHVESSFTVAQRPYIGVSIAALNMLAQGRLATARHASVSVAPFSSRVVTRFLEQEAPEASFNVALHDSLVDLYTDFGRFYPNIMPAFSAMNSAAGVDGMQATFTQGCANLLFKALNGGEVYADYLLRKESTGRFFTGTHPHGATTARYEVWCLGQALGKNLIRATGRAALDLAANPSVIASYNPSNDRPEDAFAKFDLRAELLTSIDVALLRLGAFATPSRLSD